MWEQKLGVPKFGFASNTAGMCQDQPAQEQSRQPESTEMVGSHHNALAVCFPKCA